MWLFMNRTEVSGCLMLCVIFVCFFFFDDLFHLFLCLKLGETSVMVTAVSKTKPAVSQFMPLVVRFQPVFVLRLFIVLIQNVLHLYVM